MPLTSFDSSTASARATTRPMGMPMKDMTAVFLIDTGKYLSLNSVT